MSDIKVSLFSQILGLLHRESVKKVILQHNSDKFSKGINTWTHLVSMVFMQISNSGSLRDIASGLLSATGNLNHFGIVKPPCKSSLSYINKNRDYEVFRDIYFTLANKLSPHRPDLRAFARKIKKKIYILDSTTITLCLSLFDWAHYKTSKGAVKLHTVLDYDSGLPTYACLTDGKKADVRVAKTMTFAKNSVLVMDRAYVDFKWLYNLDSTGVTFVTRLKSNAHIEVVETFLTNDKHEHILSDEDIKLCGFYSSADYPQKLRVVTVYDDKNKQNIVLLTNNLSWTADHISQLYRARWAIESFFKQLKQLFSVKTFVGLSENAVQIQIWCSLIAILLLMYIKNKAKYPWHMSNLVAFLRLNLFVKIDLWQWADYPIIKPAKPPDKNGQLSFNF